jgi:hypothetical protein
MVNIITDPHHWNADPNPAFHFIADPDAACHFNADPDSDPAPQQIDGKETAIIGL